MIVCTTWLCFFFFFRNFHQVIIELVCISRTQLTSILRGWVDLPFWQNTGHLGSRYIKNLLETNSSPLKIDHPKSKLIFQPSIFRWELLVSGSVYIYICTYLVVPPSRKPVSNEGLVFGIPELLKMWQNPVGDYCWEGEHIDILIVVPIKQLLPNLCLKSKPENEHNNHNNHQESTQKNMEHGWTRIPKKTNKWRLLLNCVEINPPPKAFTKSCRVFFQSVPAVISKKQSAQTEDTMMLATAQIGGACAVNSNNRW